MDAPIDNRSDFIVVCFISGYRLSAALALIRPNFDHTRGSNITMERADLSEQDLRHHALIFVT